MGKEIERKFLVKNTAWRHTADGVLYKQGYIHTVAQSTVRIRVAGANGFITIKGPVRNGERAEYEYKIPVSDAEEMLAGFCHKPHIEKFRYKINHAGLVWEIDEFLGNNAGLVIAEVELQTVHQTITLPDWVGKEVTGDRRYYNASLAQKPYNTW